MKLFENVLCLLNGGYGWLEPTTTMEHMLYVFIMLVGTVLWAIVQGVICGVFATGNPEEITFNQDMEALNFMMDDLTRRGREISTELRMRIRAFFRSQVPRLCRMHVEVGAHSTSSRRCCATRSGRSFRRGC